MANTPEFKIWVSMKQRCVNKNATGYKDYGGRGIRVCRRWNESFEAFIADLGRRPKIGYSIERKNNNGNYEPSNVHWAPPSEQSRNRRNNRWLTWRGESRVIRDWSKIVDVSEPMIHKRLAKGWSVDKTLSTPTEMRGRKVWAAKRAAG